MLNRPAIPAEIRRAVLVEAGHRCAIPTCRYPNVDLHHIVPWEKCESHDFDNLIALCSNCHRRADSGEIDRKALRIYKAQLSASLGTTTSPPRTYDSIRETRIGTAGYEFEFQFPVFEDQVLQPITSYYESWGLQLLHQQRAACLLGEPDEFRLQGISDTVSGSYQIVREDTLALSIKYQLYKYSAGAAHGLSRAYTRSYLRSPIALLELHQLFNTPDYLTTLSQAAQEVLLEDSRRDREWVTSGTKPVESNFRAFNLTAVGLLFTFQEYQVDCYAAAPQTVDIPFERIAGRINPKAYPLWPNGRFSPTTESNF